MPRRAAQLYVRQHLSTSDILTFSSIFAASGAVCGLPAHALSRSVLKASSIAAIGGTGAVLLFAYLALGAYPHGNPTWDMVSMFGEGVLLGVSFGEFGVLVGIVVALVISFAGAIVVGAGFAAWRRQRQRAI